MHHQSSCSSCAPACAPMMCLLVPASSNQHAAVAQLGEHSNGTDSATSPQTIVLQGEGNFS